MLSNNSIGGDAIGAAGLRMLASEWSGPRPLGTKAIGMGKASTVTRVLKERRG